MKLWSSLTTQELVQLLLHKVNTDTNIPVLYQLHVVDMKLHLRKKTVEVSRRQFPLVWLGQQLSKDWHSTDYMRHERPCVRHWPSISGVKSLQVLFIKNLNPSSIKVSEPVESEMKWLASKCVSPQPVPQFQVLPKSNWIKIGHLNKCSYIPKQDDVKYDLPLGRANLMYFTKASTTCNLLLANESCQFFRFDRVTTNTQNLSNGVIMIACTTSL